MLSLLKYCIYCYCLHFKWFSLYCSLHVTHCLGSLACIKKPLQYEMPSGQQCTLHIMNIREIVCGRMLF